MSTDQPSPFRVLHLEDSTADMELIQLQLESEWPDCKITTVSTREPFVAALKEGLFDIILSDFTLGGFDGMSALTVARNLRPEIPFIFVSGTIGEDRAVDAMRSGASDYVIKDRPKRLTPAIRRALENARQVRERKAMEDRLLRVQRLENIGMLTAGIAHDFNNVLAPVLMAGQLLRARLHDPKDTQLLDTVEQSARRGAGLVRELLGFATGATGASHLVQARLLIEDLLRVMRQTFPASIEITHDIDAVLWHLKVNPTHLYQVLLNLCVNARDAMPAGGTLRLRAANRQIEMSRHVTEPARKPGPYVLLEVADSGEGIPPGIIERIWDPFFTTKGDGRGTGLGLSTVRSIVENYGGFMTVNTQLGHGTTFQIFLPANPEAETIAITPADAEVPRGDGELILVADDDAAVRDVVSATLTCYGYKVLVAADGAEALSLYAPRSLEIRAVIADLNMPDVDGPALMKVLRSLNPSIRVLAISGLGERPGCCRPETNTPFLSKPFSKETLLTSLRELLLADKPNRPQHVTGAVSVRQGTS